MAVKPLRIMLADLTHINEVNQHNMYVPLNIGYVAAYVLKRFGAEVDVSLFKDPVKLLRSARENPPAILGLGAYYWRNALNEHVAMRVKEINRHTAVVVGGPCIDSAADVQDRYMLLHPNYDAIIPNEGEVAFGNFVEMMLGNGPNEYDAMGGVIARNVDGGLSRGSFINLSTDLSEIPSPYLDGFMDEWLEGSLQPLLQTARLCPYTCAFCVSGKDRGKMRAFDRERVREEVDYVARKFRGPRDTLFYIVDENFGIMERDIAIADDLLRVSRNRGYPRRVYFYNDKRFTHIARAVHERVGHMVWHGVCLSLQSENPEALKAMQRRNLTDQQLVDALAWAKGLGFKTSTELIFGVPGETLASYCATVDKCARLGFDVVNSYNLITFDGVEMDRARYRAAHAIETRLRPIHGSASVIDGDLVVESEEVVVSSKTFTIADFLEIRRLNVLLKAVYALGIERAFFAELIASGRSLSAFLLRFGRSASDDADDDVSMAHRVMCRRLNETVHANLFDEQGWNERTAALEAGPHLIHLATNAFLPPEAYAGGWLNAALSRTLAALTAEERDDDSSHDRREGTEGALHPDAGGRGVGAQ